MSKSNGTVFITGGSGGIGAATAELFARDRRPLILWARRREKLDSVAKRCRDLGAPSVHVAEIDVRDRTAIDAEIRKNEALYRAVDILINNAGLAKGMVPFQDAKPEDFAVMIDTNLTGFLHVTQAILPFFLANDRGHLVHLGSAAARWAYPKGHVYCATKAAVHSLTETLRLDLNGTAIRVTEISPGMVNTDFSTVRFGDAERAKAVYAGMTPLLAEDIADTIHWAATRPAHVNIQEMVIYPVAQANTTLVSRRPNP
ncbi:MAG: SDR family NAD(P)-dependent oxidoreductase [Bdellovibrionales bacterium]|nr:SDR family NAD(P)-dependent oxidoreductase [Bdellovibrionales bacterium]